MTLNRRQILGLALTAPALGLLSTRLQAQTALIYAEDGIAIDGSDVVAYFDENGPVAGDPMITTNYMGATWRFVSEENRAKFEADPMAYAPQYGGYCAYAVSQGYTASTAPEAWSIVDGKLYLNFSTGVRRRWLQDVPGHIAAADANWPAVLG